MREYLPVIRRSILFRGIEEEEILAMLKCLQVHVRSFEKEISFTEMEKACRRWAWCSAEVFI